VRATVSRRARSSAASRTSCAAISDESSEVVRLVRSTLLHALMIGASDIHNGDHPRWLVIKFRIDGHPLADQDHQDAKQAGRPSSRVKVLAELDITERRVPRTALQALGPGRAVDSASRLCDHLRQDACCRIPTSQSLYESTRQQLSLDSLVSTSRP